MNTANGPALPASPSAQSSQPQLSGGLHLTGTVIAVRTEEKEWEKEKYTQTTIEVSDGEQVFGIRHKHDEKPWNAPKLFSQIVLRVDYATTEKGRITCRGRFV